MPEPSVPVRAVFLAALRLGLTSFGGPIAHLGYFRREYVDRRRWVDATTFADHVALCQALPGPASSQLGIAIGTAVAGRLGGLAAWVGFTTPSAVAMVLFASVARTGSIEGAGWIHGLELAAVAVVAVAVGTMARTGAADLPRAGLAILAAIVALAAPLPATGPLLIVGGAMAGAVLLRRPETSAAPTPNGAPAALPRGSVVALGSFVGLLVALPVLRALDGQAAAIADTFYRTGSLVFGGGHVVLPLLHAGTVEPGWVREADFVAGYGVAQALPGPLFTFAAYLGAVSGPPPNGLLGGLIALGAIFLPSLLLVFGVLPAWSRLRVDAGIRSALDGAGAAVVGLVFAALVDPVATTGLRSWPDAVVAALAACALVSGRVPVVAVVAGLAAFGQLAG